MEKIGLFLIAIFLVVATAFVCYFVLIAKLKTYEAKIKKHALTLLALNASHLHDSANFFSLIRANLEKTDYKTLDRFCKGAQFHFRSLFDDLKLSIEELEMNSLAGESSRLSIYQIAAVDLKDLLDLELLQISNLNRLEILDKSNSQNALINGNFTLLSKALVNLVENALQHSKNKIKLTLIDNGSQFEIQVSSTGKGIPEAVINEIKIRDLSVTNLGHGLTGLAEIMDFHDAQIRIDNLLTDGACIRLMFNKYLSKQIKSKTTKKNGVKNQTPKTKTANPSNYLVLVSSLSIFFVLGLGFYSYNHKNSKKLYEQKTRGFLKINQDANLVSKKTFFKNELINLERLSASSDTQNQKIIDELKNKILENLNSNNRDFAELLLIEFQYPSASHEYLDTLEQEALALINRYPGSKTLNYLCAKYYDSQNHGSKSLYYKSKFILSALSNFIYLNPDLYVSKKFTSSNDRLDLLSSFFALNSDYISLPSPDETQAPSGFTEDTDLLNGDSLTNTNPIAHTLSEEEKRLIHEAESLIDKQNKKLGL
jgi:hypothetical protein